MISDQTYLSLQKIISERIWFRRFWVFWAIYITIFFYLGFAFFFSARYRVMATLAFIAFLLARFVFCEIIYFFYKKTRPYQRLNFIIPTSKLLLSWTHKRSNSFPSGHAASLTAISTVTWFFLPALGLLGLIAALLNGIARIILGYHHLSDILVGWAIGILAGLITYFWLAPIIFK